MEIKVSIYEDQKEMRESLEMLLQGLNGIALTGSYANCNNIEVDLISEVPNVVLMDIEMPGINGIEGLKKIKQKYNGINILMLTVFEDNDNVFKALCAGATGYLLKSTPPAKIAESIFEVYYGGAPMTPSIARKALEFLHVKRKHDTETSLTNREVEILRLLEQGNSSKMIASSLNITYLTVRTHIKNIYEKLQACSATDALYKARKDDYL